MSMKAAVIGTGYVGLVSGTCMAEIGHQVICVDRDRNKVERLQQAQIPIYEPDLEPLVLKNMAQGRLQFTTSIADAAAFADIILIAVGTPSLPNGEVDLSQLDGAIIEVAGSMDAYKVIVIKSTVPVGTAARVETLIRSHCSNATQFDIVSNPEFLREGSAVYDTFHMDRIIIGATNAKAASIVRDLHAPFEAPVLVTDRESAELIKYASNCFLAAKISFINEVANVSEKVGADVTMVAKGMGMDPRIGPRFLNAGIGYGGFCLPKDTSAQFALAEQVGYEFKMLRAVIEVNQEQRTRFVEKIVKALDGDISGRRIAVMGLTFKPNTDDMRDAPSIDIVRLLQEKGARVQAYDPVAGEAAASLIHDLTVSADPYEALENADAMVIVTEWAPLKQLDWGRVKSLLRQPIVIDGRNVFDPVEMAQRGFKYVSVGRQTVESPC